MSFLDNLLNRNPTREWRAQPGLQLVLDLDDESFCGIRLGERADRLNKLGPAEDAAAARRGSYWYGSRGFLCREEQGRFVELEAVYSGGEGQPFAGLVRRNGATATLAPQTTEPDLVAHLGKPDERKASEAEEGISSGASLTWHLNRTDCVAEFVDQQLDQLWLGTKQ
ncbi:MAG: hypothetical protein Q8Q85_03000 [Gemmatimonadales bacterium]|nr:hypothetical protein [Gemmatimonadales bacterium]